MAELPRSLPEFEARFPDEAACARWLLEKRWPDGFRCPACGHDQAWELGRERLTLQCAARERQVSVTAGTVLHGSHLPLRTWFLAAWLMATHANGISARQLWRQLGLGSYKTAWLLVRKLRRAMVDPEREPLAGLVEVDETSLPFRARGEPARPGRSHGRSEERRVGKECRSRWARSLSSRRRHTRSLRDWSSDVCSSDLRQLWRQLGLGSYKTAWLLVRKLRRAMVDPEREPLAGLVEVDETSLPFRARGEPARPGRSHG